MTAMSSQVNSTSIEPETWCLDREGQPMLFMVIERFRNRDAKAVYRWFRDQGRGAPDAAEIRQ